MCRKTITKINPEIYYVSTVCMFYFSTYVSQKYILIILCYSLHPRPPASTVGAILPLSSRWRRSTEMRDRRQKPSCSSHPHVSEISAGVGALPPVQTCLNITSVSSQRKGKTTACSRSESKALILTQKTSEETRV